MSWASWVSAGIGGWVKKGAASLGLGVISYAGWMQVSTYIHDAITGMWAGLAADTYAILALGGFVDAVGVWLGAITAAVAVLTFKRLGMLQA